MVVVAIEDREGHAHQRRLGVAFQVFAIGVADHEVHRLGEQQRTQMPQVTLRIHLAACAVGRGVEQRLHAVGPVLVAVGGQNMGGFSAQLQQEARRTQHLVRIAIEGKTLAVQMGLAVGHRVDQLTTFQFQRGRDGLAGQARNRH